MKAPSYRYLRQQTSADEVPWIQVGMDLSIVGCMDALADECMSEMQNDREVG